MAEMNWGKKLECYEYFSKAVSQFRKYQIS